MSARRYTKAELTDKVLLLTARSVAKGTFYEMSILLDKISFLGFGKELGVVNKVFAIIGAVIVVLGLDLIIFIEAYTAIFVGVGLLTTVLALVLRKTSLDIGMGGRTEEVSFKHGNRRKTMRLYEALSARILKSERELAEENEGKERKKKRSDKEDEDAPVPPVSETEGDAVSIKVPEDEVIMRID